MTSRQRVSLQALVSRQRITTCALIQREKIPFCAHPVPDERKSSKRDQRSDRQVIAHEGEAVRLRQPGCNVRRERRADDAGQVECDGCTGVADRSRKELGQCRSKWPVCQAHEPKPQGQESKRAPNGARCEERLRSEEHTS